MAIFRLRELVLPLLSMWLLAWGLGLITAISSLGLLVVSGWFVTMAGSSGLLAVGSHSFNYLAPSALIRTFAITRTLGRYGDLVVSHQTIFELLKQLRVRFFYEFARLDNHTRQRLGSSDTQYRLVQDIDTLDEFVLRVVSPAITVGISGVLLAWVVGWLYGAYLPLILLAVVAVVIWVNQSAIIASETNTRSCRQAVLVNALPALTQLVLWGQWRTIKHRFGQADDNVLYLLSKIQQKKRWAVLLTQWLIIGLFLAVLIIGIKTMGIATIETTAVNTTTSYTASDIAIWLGVLLAIMGFFEVVGQLLAEPMAYGRSVLAKQRLNELLSETIVPTPIVLPAQFDWHINDVCAKQTGAVFGFAPVSFVIKHGLPLVIGGVSGGGKSTLLDVLAGELRAKQGTMTIYDTVLQHHISVNALANANPSYTDSPNDALISSATDWQGELGYLGQQVDIFNQSLRDNLLLGEPSASDTMLWQVLDNVALSAWAKSRQGLDTPLGEYGTAISGGQARRVALARLLLRPKKILLLDEPFAGLDGNNRQRLWAILKQYQQNGLLVVVSHHRDILEDKTVDTLLLGEPVPM